ncbi:MAG: hypothetical protein NZ866_00665 [Patescibacteria group bacterium]|nr:hypothetical protein [Patescibacteria group bacterium]
MEAFIDLCDDIDGCETMVYEKIGPSGENLNIAVTNYIKYFPETSQFIGDHIGGASVQGKDGDRYVSYIISPWGCDIITDAPYSAGRAAGDDEIGLYTLDFCPHTDNNKFIYFVIRD